MTRTELYEFLRRHKLAVEATVNAGGAPQAAVVGFAVTEQLEIVFDTLSTSRKYANLMARPEVALVIGWDDEITVQIEGAADVPTGDERARLQACYFAAYPDGRERAKDPALVYVRVRPRWIRYSDFKRGIIAPLDAAELA